MRPRYRKAHIVFPEVDRSTSFIVNMKNIVAVLALLGTVCVTQPLQGEFYYATTLGSLLYGPGGIPPLGGPGGDPSHQQGTILVGGDPSHQGGSQLTNSQSPQGYVPGSGAHVTSQTQPLTSAVAASTAAPPATTTVPTVTTSNTCAVAKQLCAAHCSGGYLVDPDDCTFCVCKKDLQSSSLSGLVGR